MTRMPVPVITRSGLDRITRNLLVLALPLALTHHIDHALRVDHSGWPFRAEVTPFTYSLLAYPVILFALFGPRPLFWLRWVLLAGAAGFTVYAHTVFESPHTQFHMWAQNSSAHDEGVHNALNVRSRALGVLSVTVGMALNIVAVASAAFMLRLGLRAPRQ